MISAPTTSETDSWQATVYCAPLKKHPSRPVVVWAIGRYFFAVNLATNTYESWRKTESNQSVRSIEFFSHPVCSLPSSSASDSSGRCLLTTDDKTIVVLDDLTYNVTERFLLRKRPVAVCVCESGDAFIWGDRFGDLMKISFAEAREMTAIVLRETAAHLNSNAKDHAGFKAAQHIQEQFADHPALGSDPCSANTTSHLAVPTTMQPDESSANSTYDSGYEEYPHRDWAPFAGHMAAITALIVTPNGSKLISADRDEKARIGSVHQPHITLGYCLGHTEFITTLCCVSSADDQSDLLVTGSGDKTLRLWDISDTGVQLDIVELSCIPSAVYFSEETSSCLVICEAIQGVIKIDLKPPRADSCDANQRWSFGPQPCTIQLPSIPLALLPVTFSHTEANFLAFAQLTFSDSQPETERIPSFYWLDREGRLHVPVAIQSGMPLFKDAENTQWIGADTGEPITPEPLLLWKHNREPTAISEEEQRHKRLRHRKKTIESEK